jgi:rubrerythrin
MTQYDPDPARSCGVKRKYHTKGEARRAKRVLRRVSGDVLDVYRCRACGWLHLGHRRGGADQRAVV